MTVSTNPYTSQSISLYNSSPPPDDGTTGADNLVTWAKHKTKLADPIKTLAENINSQLTTAFAKSINTATGVRNSMAGSLAFTWATATIGNSITAPESTAVMLSGATTDTLFDIQTSNVYDGAIMVLKPTAADEDITLLHATATTAATATGANIYLGNKRAVKLGGIGQTITLMYDSTTASGWVEQARGKPGRQTLYVPAVAIRPTNTAGAATPVSTETTAGNPDIVSMDFNPSTTESGTFSAALPDAFDNGVISYRAYWTSTSTATTAVVWSLAAVAVGDGDSIDASYGTAVTVTDTNLETAEDLHISDESSDVTIGGSPAARDAVFFQVKRVATDSSDTLSSDASLIGVKIFYEVESAGD